LVIDLDEQRNVLLTFQEDKNSQKDITDFLLNGAHLKDVIINVSTGLDIINGPKAGTDLEFDIREKVEKNPLMILKEKLKENKHHYQFIFIDTAPNFGFPTALGMVAADEILIPFKPDMYGSSSLIDTLNEVENLKKSLNPELKINKIIPVLVDKRSKHHKKTIEECEEFLNKSGLKMSKVKVWETKDGINTLFEENRPPILSRRSNKLKQVYKNLAQEVIQ
jgi:chromosome partitioning protein